MKYVYLFNECKEIDKKEKLGKKETYLLDITNLGLPVPEGFIITTDACNQYYKDNQKINNEILEQINEYIIKLEQLTGKTFGNNNNPLLVAIKCSSKNEIPNLMDTILNVGLTEEIVESLSSNTTDFRWIWKCYINFINDYAKNIKGINLECFQHINDLIKDELTIQGLKNIANILKDEYKRKTQTEFPDNSLEQLYSIIDNAFKSWNNQRANIYITDVGIPFTDGLSICIQSMVFGNINKNCKTGTIFTRDPLTGDKNLTINSSNISFDSNFENSTFTIEFPKEYKYLKNICQLLENHYKDMLKVDFVVENNKLFITQVCKGKRTVNAALKIACDFIDEEEAKKLIIK